MSVNKKGRPRKENKTDRNERVLCDICNKQYARYNITGHKRTKIHKAYEECIKIIKNTVVGYENSKGMNDILLKPRKDKEENIIYLTDKQYNFYKSLPYNILA